MGALWDEPTVVAARRKPQRNGSWVSSKKILGGACANAFRALGWPGSGSSDTDALLTSALDRYGCGFIAQSDFAWLDAWTPPEYLIQPPEPGAWAELRDLLSKKYSKPIKAWRAILDTDNNNRVCWTDFVSACEAVRFRGGVGGAWRCLDHDFDGIICLRDFDSASAELLGCFKMWAEDSFGSVELAFKTFDTDGSGSLTHSELRRACQKHNWQGDVRALFNCLGVGHEEGKSSLTLNEVAFLDSWVEDEPTEETSKEARSAFEALKGKQPQERRPSFLDAEPPQEDAAKMQSSTEGKAAVYAPVSKFEKLHRKYHCTRYAAAARPRMTRAASGPLPWLDRINRIDQEFDSTFASASRVY